MKTNTTPAAKLARLTARYVIDLRAQGEHDLAAKIEREVAQRCYEMAQK